MSALPHQIGRYEILGLIGTGGMAEVLLGRLKGPRGFERPVVIKRILPHLAREQRFVDMFLDEARIVAGIRHQNVVHVHELGQSNNELFLVMEYLEGESVAGVARRLSSKKKLLSFGLCAYVLADACAGLHAAHELKDPDGRTQGLVHRDVSPANIFVTYAGGVRLLDFGIATAEDRVSKTEAGQVKGKYAYMSPEQCMGYKLDRRSDIFSLGIVLYELSTCRRLFKRSSDMLTQQAICTSDAPSPVELVSHYPEPLAAICLKALNRDPSLRYQTALEMRKDLLDVAQALNGGRVPEESLARVMKKIFPDRLEEKRAMLRRIKEGEDLTSVPPAETDLDHSIMVGAADPLARVVDPESSGSMPNSWSGTGSGSGNLGLERPFSAAGSITGPMHGEGSISGSAVQIAPRLKRSKKWWVLGAVAALLLIVGIGVAATDDEEAPGGAQRVVLAEPPKPKPKPEPVQKAKEPTTVKVLVKTTPPGARLYMNGRPKGETPVLLELERGTAPVRIELKRSGYAVLTDKIVPDMDQRVRLTLSKLKTKTVKRPVIKKRPPPPVKKEPEDPYKRFN